MKSTEVVLFDLDGTLADVSVARHHVLNCPRDFDAFHKYATSEAPINPAVVALLQAFDFKMVLFVSARKEKWRVATAKWLVEHLTPGTKEATATASEWSWATRRVSSKLYLRGDNDNRKDAEVKRDIHAVIVAAGMTPILAVDDNPAIVALWQSLGILTVQVPGWIESQPESEPESASIPPGWSHPVQTGWRQLGWTWYYGLAYLGDRLFSIRAALVDLDPRPWELLRQGAEPLTWHILGRFATVQEAADAVERAVQEAAGAVGKGGRQSLGEH